MTAMEPGRPPLTSRARRVWRRTAANIVTNYIRAQARACEPVDLGQIRAMLTSRARTAGVGLEDVDAVMREVEVPGDHAAVSS